MMSLCCNNMGSSFYIYTRDINTLRYEEVSKMLRVYDWFRVTTYAENEEILSKAIEEFDVEVESERYVKMKDGYRLVLECHIDEDKFDGFVEHLKQVFADTWATITY